VYGLQYALIQTRANPGTKVYNGVGGRLSVYNLQVEPDQFTSGEYIIQNGEDRLQVGFTVNHPPPRLLF